MIANTEVNAVNTITVAILKNMFEVKSWLADFIQNLIVQVKLKSV